MRLAAILISILLLLPAAHTAQGVKVFKLSVGIGAKSSYIIVEAYNASVGEYYFRTGDRIDYTVMGRLTINITYTNGSTAFMVEIPLCNVRINGKLIMINDTPQRIGLYSPYAPPGREYWEAQLLVLRDLKRSYERVGGELEYSISFKEGRARLTTYIRSRDKGEMEEEIEVDMASGRLLRFRRVLRSSTGDVWKIFEGVYTGEAPGGGETSKPPTSTTSKPSWEPRGGSLLWIGVLAAMVVIVLLGGILTRGRR